MSSANPYYNPNEDADLFAELEGTDGESSETTQEFTKKQKMYGPDGKELPEDIQKELGQFVQVGSLDNRSSNTPPQFKAMTYMMEFYASMTTFKYDAPLIAAVAKVVDQMSNGQVTRYYQMYEAQRKLLYSHVVAVFAGIMVKLHQETDIPNSEELIQYCLSLQDINAFVRAKSEREYRAICEELGEEVDEILIERGRFNGISLLDKIAFGNPPTVDAEDEVN